MATKRPSLNILVIEENRQLYELLTRELDGLLPERANVVCCADLARGLADLRNFGFFQIVVLGTDDRHLDAHAQRRLELVRLTARRQPKTVLFAGRPPADPNAMEANHIVNKPDIKALAAAIAPLMDCFSDDDVVSWLQP